MKDLEKLRKFAQDILSSCQDYAIDYEIDEFYLHDIAVKHGLIEPVTVYSPCGDENTHCYCNEYCHSDEFKDGVECFRKTKTLTGEL